MTNQEIILNDLKYLTDLGVNIKIFVSITNPMAYVVESNAQKINFDAQELKAFLADLKTQVCEEIARKYNKQVFNLSLGDIEK